MGTNENLERLGSTESFHPVVEYMMSEQELRLRTLRQMYDITPGSSQRLQVAQTMRDLSAHLDEATYGYSGPLIAAGEIDLTLSGIMYGPDLFCYTAHTVDQIVEKLTLIPFSDDEITDYERLTELSKYAQLTYFDKTTLRASDMAKMALCVSGLCTTHDHEARTTLIETARDLYPAIALRAISYRSSSIVGPKNTKEFFGHMTNLSLKILEDTDQSEDFLNAVEFLYQQGDHRIMTQIAYFLGKELTSEKPSAMVINYLFDTYCRVLHNTGGVVSDTCGSDVKPAFVIGLRWSNATPQDSVNTLLSFVNKNEWADLTSRLGLEAVQAGEVTPEKVINTCAPGMFATVLGKSIKDRVAVFNSHSYQPDFVSTFTSVARNYEGTGKLHERATSPHKYIDEEGHITQTHIDGLRSSENLLLTELVDAVFIEQLSEQELALLNIAKAKAAESDEQDFASSLVMGRALKVVSADKSNGIFSTPYKLIRLPHVTGITCDVNGNLFGYASVDGEVIKDPKDLLKKSGLPKAAENYLREGD